MTKAISVKELRMNFPKILKDLKHGIKFTLIYRSKPIAYISPIELYSEPFDDQIHDGNRYLPATMEEFLKNIDKYRIKLPKVKTVDDVVKLIRKDRGYED